MPTSQSLCFFICMKVTTFNISILMLIFGPLTKKVFVTMYDVPLQKTLSHHYAGGMTVVGNLCSFMTSGLSMDIWCHV